jgi:hypothetical protein
MCFQIKFSYDSDENVAYILFYCKSSDLIKDRLSIHISKEYVNTLV